MPHDFLAWHELSDLLGRVVKVFVAVRKLGTEFVGSTGNFSGPPPTNVVDGVKDLFGRLGYRKGRGVILIFHDFIQFRGLRMLMT
jgi:hypothetical protein